MHFDESTVGEYRVFSGAIESPVGDGYIAALVVLHHCSRPHKAKELYRDESLACGHRWPSAAAALSYAMSKGQDVIRKHMPALAC